jgi:type I restriction enzyme S subunit
MNADQLLTLYERISEAPDAIARLRRFVLDLAVHGKLVDQDAADGSASELLKRIAAEKARLVKAGELKPRKINVRKRDVEPVFDVPLGWVLTELGDVALKITDGAHKTPTYVDVGIPFVSVKDFSGGNLDLSNTRLIPEHEHRALYQRCDPRRGDILIGRIGTLGKAVLVNTDIEFSLFVSVGLIRFDQRCINPDFFRLVLNSPFVAAEFNRIKIGGGTHTNKLNLGDLHTVAFPLPPLAEQHRIVAKVDELMTLCDQLEAARTAREATRDRLTTASLTRLTAPDTDAETFRSHARFALDALPALTTRPDQIKTLRQTILNLAVQGKLGEDAAAKIVKIGNYRKLQNGYAFKSEWFTKTGTRLLRNANIGHGEIRWEDTVFLPEDRVSEFERFHLSEGDIVLTLDRPFIVTGTKVARVTKADLPSLLLQRVGRFVETKAGLSDDYLFLWINSPNFNDQIDPGRSNGVPHISSKQVEAAEIFVPSLAEQHRIVAKVDALMTLCDRLEASLTAADTTRRRLLEALLHEALEPAADVLEAAE